MPFIAKPLNSVGNFIGGLFPSYFFTGKRFIGRLTFFHVALVVGVRVGEFEKVVGLEKKRTLHPWRCGGFDGNIGMGIGNWKLVIVIKVVVFGVLRK